MILTELDRFLKRCRNIRETNRSLAVKLAFLGFPYDMICNLIGVSKSLITKWKKKYKKHGINHLLLGYKGSKPYLTYEQQDELIEWLKSRCSWCLEEVIEHIKRNYCASRPLGGWGCF